MALRHHPIHKSMHRPNLFMGVDRVGAITILLATGDLVFIGLTKVSIITAVVVWVVGFAVLRRMAKVDPQLGPVYSRYIQYEKLMPARATAWRQTTQGQVNHYKTPA